MSHLSARAMEQLIAEHEAEYGEALIEYCNAGHTENRARELALALLEERYGRGGGGGGGGHIEQWSHARELRRRAMSDLLVMHCPPGCYPHYALRDFEREADRQVTAGIPLPALDALRHLIPFEYRPATERARAWLARVMGVRRV